MKIDPHKLVLASRSPRRRLLLRDAGVEARVIDPQLDDGLLSAPDSVTPEAWVCALAYLKARAGAERLGAGDAGVVVLGADTIVVKNGRVLGQPRDRAHAGEMIRTLRNGRHEVVTGVALVGPGSPTERMIFADTAKVEVGSIPDDAIERYLDSGDWRGKAGAYNLAERQAAGWPIAVEGDPATVMGLPIRRLAPMFARTDTPGRSVAEATPA